MSKTSYGSESCGVSQIELPGGATVDIRDKIKAGDKFAVQDAARMSLDTVTGLQETAVGIVNVMRNALLKQVIKTWTVCDDDGNQMPTPANAGDRDVLADMDLDDYNALSDAVEPMLSKVMNTAPNPSRRSGA